MLTMGLNQYFYGVTDLSLYIADYLKLNFVTYAVQVTV